MYTHKAIRDACVVGMKDETAGEVPVAFVVLQPNAKISEKEIVDYVNGECQHGENIKKRISNFY